MTSRNSACPGSGSGAGFTLIEVMVVMVVVGLMLAIVASRGPMRSAGLEAHMAARHLAQMLRAARAEAIVANRLVDVTLDPAGHWFRVGAGPKEALPASLAVAASATPGGSPASRTIAIRFAPDGSGSGGRIALSRGKQMLVVAVDWVTGRVSLADAR
jgi:general secretion pathway protein H